MRNILIVLIVIILTGCLKKNDCNNRYELSSCSEDIPIIPIDYSQHPDTIRVNIEKHFDYNLCDSCSWTFFRIPFLFDGKDGYLKVMVDYDSPICDDCPCPIRLRYYYTVMINSNNQLLVNGRPMKMDSLNSSVMAYFENVGNENGHYPEKYRQVNFRMVLDRETEKSSIESVLTGILNAYLNFVEQKVIESGVEFCKLTAKELEDLRHKYPLRIEFDLGKIDLIGLPPDKETMEKLEKIMEEMEDKMIKEDVEMEVDL